MSARKFLGGLAVLLAVVLASSGAVLAQDETYPIDPPPEVGGDEQERDGDDRERGRDGDVEDEARDRGPAVQGQTESRDGALPFTGLELLGLVLVGVALVAAGVALVAWRRRRAAVNQLAG